MKTELNNFDCEDNIESFDSENVNIRRNRRKELAFVQRKYLKNKRSTKNLTNDISNDFFNSLDYVPLSREAEIHLVKKAKLAFYDEVDEETRNLYLEYYKAEFPKFKDKYENALALEKEKLLEEAILNSKEWRDEFFKNNERLVFSIARKYQERCKSFTFMDLVQEGNIGIYSALLKFDLAKENKFSTYATWWIRQAIIRAIANSDSTIRQPVAFYGTVQKVRQVKNELYNQLQRDPTAGEVIEKANISYDMLKRVEDYMTYGLVPASLEEPTSENGDSIIGDFVISDDPLVEDSVETSILNQKLIEILENSGLSERELAILRLRYGFDNDFPMTLQQVADEFSLTRERIRQIECKILNKLRKNIELREFCSDGNKRYKVKSNHIY